MTFVDEIQKLQTLRNSGALSEAEFNQAKAQLLSTEPSKTPQSSNSAMTFIHKIGRSRKDSMLGGVCGGLALHTSLPAWVWRLIFASAVLLSFGTAAIVYILLWILMPFSDAENTPNLPTQIDAP